MTGIIIYNVSPTEYQKAIDLAGKQFYARFSQAPGYVALPPKAPGDLDTHGLPLASTPAPPGTVIMWPKRTYVQQEMSL